MPIQLPKNAVYSSVNETYDNEVLKLPDYCDVMSIDKFLELCKAGAFIDSDGYANPITNHKLNPLIEIYPSDMLKEQNIKEFDQVAWFNK